MNFKMRQIISMFFILVFTFVGQAADHSPKEKKKHAKTMATKTKTSKKGKVDKKVKAKKTAKEIKKEKPTKATRKSPTKPAPVPTPQPPAPVATPEPQAVQSPEGIDDSLKNIDPLPENE